METTRKPRFTRLEPVHHGILVLDIARFGRLGRSDLDRVEMRGELHRLMERGLRQAELEPDLVDQILLGDGLLALIDPRVSTARLLDPLIPSIATDLERYNRSAPAPQQFRLRAAVHAGEVLDDPYGYVGQALNTTFRLVNAHALRKFQASTTASLVLIVSDEVYQTIVRAGHGSIEPSGFRPVWVEEKETRARAWLHAPGDGVQHAGNLRIAAG